MKIATTFTKKKARIEIIPLIDIVFFLLATFAMTSLSMVKNQGVSVNLPVASTSRQIESEKAVVTLSVKEDGTIYLDKEEMEMSGVESRLSEIVKTHADVNVVINGDEKAYFGKAISLLDTVRRLGISKVSIRTKTS